VGYRAGSPFEPDGPAAQAVLARLGRAGWRRVPAVPADALAPGDCALVETRSVAVSAREVRERLAAGESVRYRVPLPVAEYIAQHRLYEEPA
jgi:nicotinate-nucleotide adenylyltransferase